MKMQEDTMKRYFSYGENNPNVNRADDALHNAISAGKWSISGWTSGYDMTTGEVLIFLRLNSFDINKEYPEEIRAAFKKAWQDAKFEIIEEEEVRDTDVSYVAYPALVYRLKSTAKMNSGMEDNLSFEENANVERADDALNMVGYILRGWTIGFDEDTGDVLIFLPAEDFLHISKERKEAFFNALKKAWQDAKFEVLHEEKIDGDVYFHVGFCSYFFRLKSIL